MPALPPPCLEAALAYLKRGWSPIALCPPDHHGVPGEHEQSCKSPGKAPLWSWKAYQDRLPSEKELKLWWSRNPRANVGVCMGPVSGIVGIDIDDQAGIDLLADICNGIPDTFNFSTPGGSQRRRLFFRHPDAVVPTKSLRVNGVEVLRIQGKGAQTVMPPSIHVCGLPYGLECEDRDLADVPRLLLDFLLQEPDKDTTPPTASSPLAALPSAMARRMNQEVERGQLVLTAEADALELAAAFGQLLHVDRHDARANCRR